MRFNDDVQKLRAVLQKAYDKISDAKDVSPVSLATAAFAELDPQKVTPSLIYIAAHLQLRQIGRSICRDWFQRDDDHLYVAHSLFPDLQNRYPISRTEDSDPVYRLLEHLSKDDWQYNVIRLRREAAGKMKHADALEAWGQQQKFDSNNTPPQEPDHPYHSL